MKILALAGSPRTHDYLGVKFAGKILAKPMRREKLKKIKKP